MWKILLFNIFLIRFSPYCEWSFWPQAFVYTYIFSPHSLLCIATSFPLFSNGGARRVACGKKTNCETVTCSQGKLCDRVSSPLLLAQGVRTEFTWQISVLWHPAASKPAAKGSKVHPRLPCRFDSHSVAWLPPKTDLQTPTFSLSFFISHRIPFLLPSFDTACLWVLRRYIKH